MNAALGHSPDAASAKVPGPMDAARPLLERAGLGAPLDLVPLAGGRNNRVYRLETADGPVVLKHYFRHPDDPRDRLGAELDFLRFADAAEIAVVPRPLSWDREVGALLMQWLPGRRLAPDEVRPDHVVQSTEFLASVCEAGRLGETQGLAPASEACFSMADHLAVARKRVERLQALDPADDLDREARSFARGLLAEALGRASRGVVEACKELGQDPAAPLPARFRMISPSDFGLHNALLGPDGRLRFIDFEYAGRDDPAKAVCDYFCQPEAPAPRVQLASMARSVGRVLCEAGFEARVAALFPLYRVKWSCIVLNDFLRIGGRRRAHALGKADRRAAQLAKALTLLESDDES